MNKLIKAWKEKVFPLISLVWITGFIIAAFSLWIFLQITERVMAEETTEIDTAILQNIYKLHTPLLNQVMSGITFLGNGSTLIFLISLVVIFLLVMRKFINAFALVIATSGGTYLNVWLKELVARARPELWERIVEAKLFSFPSGHAMVSLVTYGFISYLLISKFRSLRVLISFFAAFLILAIGFSRLYLGVHWPTDIAAGYAAGLVWLITCIITTEIFQFLLRSKNQQPASN